MKNLAGIRVSWMNLVFYQYVGVFLHVWYKKGCVNYTSLFHNYITLIL